jgi:5'-3' exonuclease
MGIRLLNSYLNRNCSTISKISFSALSGSTIVIDTSIYLYKFKALNTLLDSMKQLLQLFKKYSITPIFIFDGKPKQNKKQTLIKRQKEKANAWETYLKVKDTESKDTLQKLRNQYIRVNQTDVETIKEMMDTFKVRYIQAPYEADEICARMMNHVKYCMSDDMDMFAYGCTNILRSVNIHDETMLLYNLKKILKELNISQKDFQLICSASGTDYTESTLTIYDWFQKYDSFIKSGGTDFYECIQVKNQFDILSNDFDYLDEFILPSSGNAGSCIAED